MGSFELRWKASAVKELKAFPEEARTRVLVAVSALSEDPFPVGNRQLRGSRTAHRLRIGDYRVVYSV